MKNETRSFGAVHPLVDFSHQPTSDRTSGSHSRGKLSRALVGIATWCLDRTLAGSIHNYTAENQIIAERHCRTVLRDWLKDSGFTVTKYDKPEFYRQATVTLCCKQALGRYVCKREYAFDLFTRKKGQKRIRRLVSWYDTQSGKLVFQTELKFIGRQVDSFTLVPGSFKVE